VDVEQLLYALDQSRVLAAGIPNVGCPLRRIEVQRRQEDLLGERVDSLRHDGEGG
jgi:hypothetical protein